ncbi:hypothetical protein EUX98_g4593 [Antrodiella citrinella]|uniref:Uncharacterized protein n=1 Tax=Antrodiella citrinella TaxID=2447956 RepID=A0A4V3XIL7_9APHY|nr:hypothetical protein EUX98_g4593 [Antrodiella citrinella]
MKILTAKQVAQGQGEDSGFYRHSDDLLKAIDAIEVGDAPWESFTIRYSGPLPLDAPQWKREGYTVYTRNMLTVVRNMLKSSDFKNSFDYTPFQEYIGVNERRWSNFMSGHWAWKQADMIAADPDTHHSMFCPIILGADKTTASVATGHTQFHPLYMSIGNVSNEMRRAHREALMPTAFLAIPKADIVPFTSNFPRADIHELLSPDLLHQLIKGTFKDHLVAWVFEYIDIMYGGGVEGKAILADIDKRIAAAPAFPGLRRFPEGRNFEQWTGNDSKALMKNVKIFLPAIAGHIPDQMVQCVAALLDFSYLARRNSHDATSLQQMQEALDRFHATRTIFEDVGVRPDGFCLPRQHSLRHYIYSIKLFGSPNGLCSSITESRHISAVKQPYRRSSRNKALLQMLTTSTRLSKLAAARVEFGRRGMLVHDIVRHAQIEAGLVIDVPDEVNGDAQAAVDDHHDDEDDVEPVDGPRIAPNITLSVKPAYTRFVNTLADELHHPSLPLLIHRFIYDQLYPDLDANNAFDDELPEFNGRISVHYAAFATFYAPSELCGPGGMHQEAIRSNPNWRNEYARYDTVLVQNGAEDDSDSDDDNDEPPQPMGGMLVARVLAFLAFSHEDVRYPCAMVEWFLPHGDEPDPATGMWLVRPEMHQGHRTIITAMNVFPSFEAAIGVFATLLMKDSSASSNLFTASPVPAPAPVPVAKDVEVEAGKDVGKEGTHLQSEPEDARPRVSSSSEMSEPAAGSEFVVL